MKGKFISTSFGILVSILGGLYFIRLGISMMKIGTDESWGYRFWGIECGLLVVLIGILFLVAFRLSYLLERWPQFFKNRFWGVTGILLALNYGVVVPLLLLLGMLPSLDVFDWTGGLRTGIYLAKIAPPEEASGFGYALLILIILTLISGGITLLGYSLRRLGQGGKAKEVQLQRA